MKQLLQNLRTGELYLEDVPSPQNRSGCLLIQTTQSLISAGTERMVVDFAKAGLIQKAKQQPDKVKQVLEKIGTDGLGTTLEAVFNKLDQPLPLGYSNVGRVIEVGKGVEGYSVGDRVLSNGRHAELVSVPSNLCAPIPDAVGDEAATFTVVASIGLQGVRLVQPQLGELVCVFGLGLIGLISAQLLQAAGARVIAFDISERRVSLARTFGVEAHDTSSGLDPIEVGKKFSSGVGVDAVLITASTKNDELIHQAAEMSRKRGRIVLTGVTGLNLRRSDFYEKELSFQVSCSYGPGRYDPKYEEQGQDYPIAFVRWTENRNFQAVLDLLARKRLMTDSLVSARYQFDEAVKAYTALSDPTMVGIVMQYEEGAVSKTNVIVREPTESNLVPDSGAVGVIGAGNFTQMRMFPNLTKEGARVKWVASGGGTTAAIAARRFKVRQVTSNYQEILEDAEVSGVFITTRHNSHAKITLDALRAGKHVYVEKPMCLNRAELEAIRTEVEAQRGAGRNLRIMVGFNRRFSSLCVDVMKELETRTGPLSISVICNAGSIPGSHWTQGKEGGGRVIGEAIHFVDFIQFLCGSPIETCMALQQTSDRSPNLQDNVVLSLRTKDGSIGQVSYFSNGSKSYPKEQFQIFFDGKVITIDNFLVARAYGCRRWKKRRLYKQDKGHQASVAAFLRSIKSNEKAPIPFEDLVNSHIAVFDALDFMNSNQNPAISTSDVR